REKEEELIFRGFQYAEAIRLYHNQFQQYPTKLEDLLNAKPRRCIRQLWKDPMAEDGKWALIFQNGPQGPLQPQPDGTQGPQAQQGQISPSDQKGEQSTEEDENGRGEPQFGPKKGEIVAVGPIVGVRSKSHEKSFIVLFGRERYDEWTFTESVLLGGQAGPGQTPSNLQLSYRWLGRPLRFLNQPPDATLPNANPTGQKNPTGRPRPSRP
ncbi:MAG TPA: hypothetical protein VIC28_11145, partial [Thermoanaerobaculia bacterium]